MIKVMESQTPGYGVEETRIWSIQRDYVGHLEFEEEDVSQDSLVARVADNDEDEENYRNKIAAGGDEDGISPMVRHGRLARQRLSTAAGIRRE